MGFFDDSWMIETYVGDHLLSALREDPEQAEQLLRELSEPLTGKIAGHCLRQALDCSPELFRQVLDHCAPGEYTDGLTILDGEDIWNSRPRASGRGSILLLAAMADKPDHVRALLEHGWDCNGAGLELAANQDYIDCSVPAYGTYGGARGSVLQTHGPSSSARIACATPP